MSFVYLGCCHCGCGRRAGKMQDGTQSLYCPGHHPLELTRRKSPTPRKASAPQDESRTLREPHDSWCAAERSPIEVKMRGMSVNEVLLDEVQLDRCADILTEHKSLCLECQEISDALEFALKFIKSIWGSENAAAVEICGRLNTALDSYRDLGVHFGDISAEAPTGGSQEENNTTHRTSARERLQARYLELLDRQRLLEPEHKKLSGVIDYAIHFARKKWRKDKDAVRVLVCRLKRTPLISE